MLKPLLFLPFLLFSLIGHSQDYVDLFKFTYSNSPFNKEDSVNGTARVQEFYVDLTLPIKINEKTVFITGATIEQLSVNTRPSGFNINSVLSTTLKLGLNLKHSKKWAGTYMILPKIRKDI